MPGRVGDGRGASRDELLARPDAGTLVRRMVAGLLRLPEPDEPRRR